ncbi:MAG: hypothetical protein VW125_08325, partial [Flavobacteriaceae bacterium]
RRWYCHLVGEYVAAFFKTPTVLWGSFFYAWVKVRVRIVSRLHSTLLSRHKKVNVGYASMIYILISK